MKNLKNMVAAASLMAVMGFGAVSANAGLLVTDKSAQPCAVKDNVMQQLAGVFNALSGFIITDRDGIIIIDKQAAGCEQAKDGLLITDRDGIIIIDKQ